MTKEFATEAKARDACEKQIRQKITRGYTEIEKPTIRGSRLKQSAAVARLHKPFLESIAKSPDDITEYMVYADWLLEQGDPRGEFIHLQLQLEDETVPQKDRAKLKQRESELTQEYATDWLGDLAPELLAGEIPESNHRWRPQEQPYQHSFHRGFPGNLTVMILLPEFAAKLKKSGVCRWLRQFVLRRVYSANMLAYEFEVFASLRNDSQSFPGWEELVGTRFDNLRHFEVNEGGSKYSSAPGVERLIRKMPRLQSLELHAHELDTAAIFKLKMPNLRSISIHDAHEYDVQALSRNSSLQNLETISFFPHALNPDDEPYLDVPHIQGICRSRHLQNVRHLWLRGTNFGDDGIKELIDSGFLLQLESLDLTYGSITDKGAELLAGVDLSNLSQLTLDGNYLTRKGVRLLKNTGVPLNTSEMFGNRGDAADWQHLYMGDVE